MDQNANLMRMVTARALRPDIQIVEAAWLPIDCMRMFVSTESVEEHVYRRQIKGKNPPSLLPGGHSPSIELLYPFIFFRLSLLKQVRLA